MESQQLSTYLGIRIGSQIKAETCFCCPIVSAAKSSQLVREIRPAIFSISVIIGFMNYDVFKEKLNVNYYSKSSLNGTL